MALHVATTYTTLATYFWMLCEGAYLQLLLMDAFRDDSKRVRGLLVVGWCLPLIVVLPYYLFFAEVIHWSQEEGVYTVNEHCWFLFGDTHYFISVPVVLVVIVNIMFLTNVIKMLRTKLRADAPLAPQDRRNTAHTINRATLKQAKAAVFLIPILGINYLLLPMRPEGEDTSIYLERLYDIVSAVTTSFQGFFVALLLCLTNSEVVSLIKKRWNQYAASRNINISFTRLVTQPFNSRSDQISEV